MVQINGLAEGFATGMQLGQNQQEIRTKRELLLREQQQRQAKVVQDRIDTTLAGLQEQVSNAAQRTPAVESAIKAQQEQLVDTAKLLAQLDPDAGQAALSRINSTIPLLKTKSEAYQEQAQGEFAGKMALVDSLSGQPAPAAAVAQQTATPAPVTAPSASPGETTTLPWLRQQPAPTGLGSVAQAALPPQPAPDELAPTESVPQTEPQAMPAPQPQGQPQGLSEKEVMRRRLLESMAPPTEEEKEQTKAKIKRIEKLEETAVTAADGLSRIKQATDLLDQGIITGAGADWRKSLSKYTGVYYDEDTIARTEQFEALMQKMVLDNIKPLGSGTAVSENDRKFINAMVGADISLSEKGLRKILGDGETAMRSIVGRFNKAAPPEMQIEMAQPPAVAGEPTVSEDGWVDLGGGIRLRKKVQ